MELKTLVIHPEDKTTDFLSVIYDNKLDWHVVKNGIGIQGNYYGSNHLKSIIPDYERIVMLGHGTPSGLIGNKGYCIHYGLVDLLKSKQLVGIWCNADQFFSRYGLKGIYTGMVISEKIEATMYGIIANIDEIDHSNKLFTESMAYLIHGEKTLNEAVEYYSGESPVIEFNRKRIYIK